MREWSIDNVLRSISEDIEDQDTFETDPNSYLRATFAQLLEEGGEHGLAQAIEYEFAPMTVLSVDTAENFVIMSNFPGYGEYDDKILARRKFKVSFSPDQPILNWGVTNLMPAIRGLEIERQQGRLHPDQHPLFFEGLDDHDEFQPGIVTFANAGDILQALRTETIHQLMDVKKFKIKIDKVIPSGGGSGEVQVTYYVIHDYKWEPTTTNVPYEAHDSIHNWIWKLAHNVYKETEYAEDLDDEITEAISPFTGEEKRDWGWQATVIPVANAQPQSTEGLDDVDEFFTGTDMWRVTITNKHYPNKELVGTVGWNYGDLIGHMPKVEDVERNDFPLIGHDFARRLVWATYWASEEDGEGRGSVEPFVIDQGNLLQIDNSGILILKHINDPSDIEKKYPHKPSGWSSVGTHTYGEAAGERPTIIVNGKPFLKFSSTSLANLAMNVYFTSPTDHYESPEDIAEAYDLFIYWGAELDIWDYEEQPESVKEPVAIGPELDDVDEFDEEGDPYAELQQQENAERHAIRAGMEMMRREFATLDKPGLELIYIGAYGTFSAGQRVEGLVVRPCAVIGKKKAPVAEGLDDKDEFTDSMVPVSATIIYDPKVVMRPVADVIEIAKMIVVEYGHMAGDFTFRKRLDDNKARVCGMLDVDSARVHWRADRGGQMELAASGAGVLAKYGEITMILEIPR